MVNIQQLAITIRVLGQASYTPQSCSNLSNVTCVCHDVAMPTFILLLNSRH